MKKFDWEGLKLYITKGKAASGNVKSEPKDFFENLAIKIGRKESFEVWKKKKYWVKIQFKGIIRKKYNIS